MKKAILNGKFPYALMDKVDTRRKWMILKKLSIIFTKVEVIEKER
jgi:hypothetical protein